MASMLEKLGAMFEEGADTTSVSISADVSVSEGTDTEVVETVDEVQDYVEASDEVEAATQEVEEVTEQMEQTVEAAETAAELRANISQYGLNKQAAALIYQFYGIDKVGSFVTPSVEAIDTVGRNYNAANQLMAALEEAEKGFKARIKAAWNWLIEKLQKFANAVREFLSPVTSRLSKWFNKAKEWAKKGVMFLIPKKIMDIIRQKKIEKLEAKLEDLYKNTFVGNTAQANAFREETAKLNEEIEALKKEIEGTSADTSDKEEVKAADTTEQGTVGKFLKWCKDKLMAIPTAIGKFIQWIKGFFTKKTETTEEVKEQTEDQKKANIFSRAWTGFTGLIRSAWNKIMSWFRKGEKKEDKSEEKK